MFRGDRAAATAGFARYRARVAVILALLSSALWGIADFSGGTASRRLPAPLVVLVSQAIGLAAAGVAAVASGRWNAPAGYLPWAVAAGLVGAAGLLLFYRALATGTMGVVSPIAALSVLIPVAVGIATGRWPSLPVGAGIVLAMLGVVAVSGPERSHGRSLRPVLLAVLAAVCFGATLLFIARGAAYSPLMTMVAMRVASVALPAVVYLAVLAARLAARRAHPRAVRTTRAAPATPPAGVNGPAVRATWLLVGLAGLADVSANLVFALASTAGALAVVAMLGSLYPAVTVLLAALVHGERLTRLQQVGVGVALIGVVLIAGWS